MQHSIHRGRWQLHFVLRGVFGHDVVNHIKSLYSTRGYGASYNMLLESVLELKDLFDRPTFTERDVEKGSFLRMENIV